MPGVEQDGEDPPHVPLGQLTFPWKWLTKQTCPVKQVGDATSMATSSTEKPEN
jgi:hypothetical protein